MGGSLKGVTFIGDDFLGVIFWRVIFKGGFSEWRNFIRGTFTGHNTFTVPCEKSKIVSFASSTMKTLLYVKIFFLVCSVFIIQ